MIPKTRTKEVVVLYSLIFLIALLLVIGVSITGYIIREEKRLQNHIYPNVYIDHVSVGRKTKKEAAMLFSKRAGDLDNLTITVLYKDTPIATVSGKQMGVHRNVDDVVERAYLIGRVSHLPSRVSQKLKTLFNRDRFDFATQLTYDKNSLSDFISLQEDKYNKPAKDALFKFENDRVVNFRIEEEGAKINSEKLISDMENKIIFWKKNPKNETVVLADQIIKPQITLAKSNQFGIEELVSEGKSNYAGSIPERVHNLTLATSRFNGILVPKDGVVSFNDIVGDISSTTGYKPAYIIKGGKTVLGDGGGVCQVSTTLFRAALQAGLPIIERTAHAYRVGYYENDSKPGFDATVYGPTVDLKIKNNTPGYLLIQTEVDHGTGNVYFRFYGKKDGRQIYISPGTLTDVSPPPDPKYQDDPTLKKGVTKQVDFAAWGGKTNFSYKVTGSGDVNFEKTFFSNFRPWQAVYLVGTSD